MTSVVAFWIFDLQIFLKVSSHSRNFLIFLNFESKFSTFLNFEFLHYKQ